MRTSRLAAFAAMACACAALCGAAPQHPSMAVTHGNHGEVSIAVDGVTWLSSNRTALTVGDRQLSSADGSLVLQSSSKASGTDGIGPFEATTWSWVPTTHRPAVEAGSVVLTTTVRTYSSDVVVFEQSFPYGVPSVSSHNFIASDFPYFLVNEVDDALPTLSSAAFGGTFATSTGKWVGSGLQQCSASEQAGPILLYAADASNFPTLVTSPLTSVKTGDIYCTGHLSFGVKGTLTSIPAGYTLSFVMSLGSGPKRAMEAWGDALLAYSGKEARADLYGDAIRSTLGFWTDNGGWFHYPGFTQPGEYKAKLQQAVEAYNASGIPVGHWQGDSWWYPKGSGGTGSSQNGGYGAYRWVVDPFVFGDGFTMADWQTDMGVPFILHNRWFDPANWYEANGIAGKWTGNDKCHLPYDFATFYKYFFAQQQSWGMITYEQDFLFTQYDNVPDMKTNATFADAWLTEMTSHAHAAGLTMQFCMPYARDSIASSQFKNVVTIRASGDYAPNGDNIHIQPQSLLIHAVGALPFKDTFLSSSNAEPGGASRAQGPELSSDLQALVATLSASIVAPGDGPDMMNATRLMQTCRTDGLVLKPDRPAVPLDVTWTVADPGGELSWTAATAADGSSTTSYVLAMGLTGTYGVKPSDLELDDTGHYVAMDWYGLIHPRGFNESAPLIVGPGQPHVDVSAEVVAQAGASPISYEYWVIARFRSPSGWALLGEPNKFVGASKMRVNSVTDGSGSMSVKLAGAAGEGVQLCAAHQKKGVVCQDATMDGTGVGSVTFSV